MLLMWDDFPWIAWISPFVAMAVAWMIFGNIFRDKKTVKANETKNLKNSKSDDEKNSTTLPIPTCTKQEDSNDLKCPICGEKGTNACSACKKVGHCCADHQKLDWKNHKNVCQAFSVQPIEGMGLGCVATRDLPAGFLLIEEVPAIQAPTWMTPDQAEVGLRRCVTCGCKIEKINRTCSLCSWPVCSAQCEKNPLHSKNECAEFVSRRLKYNNVPQSWPCGMLIVCMRANVMKAQNPEKFKELMALQDIQTNPTSNKDLQKLDLPTEMFEVLKGPNSLDRNEFRKLLRIFKVNAFPGIRQLSPAVQVSIRPETVCGVYLKISRLNHSCTDNCFSIVDEDDPMKTIKMYTAIPIAKGQQLTCNYFGWCSFNATADRQLVTRSAGFLCKCKRCLDPTELGTFLSGIKCPACSSHLRADSDLASDNVGFLLYASSLDLDLPFPPTDPDFQCNRCRVTIQLSKMNAILPAPVLQDFMNIAQWTNSTLIPRTEASPGSIESLAKLLDKYDEGRPDFKEHMHPNHWVLIKALGTLIEATRMELEKMTLEDLKTRMKRLELILMVQGKLFPGIRPWKNDYLKMWENTAGYIITYFQPGLSGKEFFSLTRTTFKIVDERLTIDALAARSTKEKMETLTLAKQNKDAEKKFERAALALGV